MRHDRIRDRGLPNRGPNVQRERIFKEAHFQAWTVHGGRDFPQNWGLFFGLHALKIMLNHKKSLEISYCLFI